MNKNNNPKKNNNLKKNNEKTVRDEYAALTRLLIERKLTITTMESCTAGQLASLITDTEGSSAVLKGAFVTYCNEAKIMQGVPAGTIEKYSVYSKQTAKSMALSCRETYGADIGIGVTGSFGNVDPANPESSVPGVVYFAISYKEKNNDNEVCGNINQSDERKADGFKADNNAENTKTQDNIITQENIITVAYKKTLPVLAGRLEYKLAIADEIYKKLIEILQKN